MSSAKLSRIPDLLEEHVGEMAFLWGQRQTALDAFNYSRKAFLDLEDRIEAHVEGLLVGGEETISVVKGGLASEDATVSFAAGYSMLRLKSSIAARVVMEAFHQAQEGQLNGIRQALCHGPIELVMEDLKQTSASAPAPIAVAACEALA